VQEKKMAALAAAVACAAALASGGAAPAGGAAPGSAAEKGWAAPGGAAAGQGSAAPGGVAAAAIRRNGPAGGFTVEQALGSPYPSQLVAARQGSRVAWVFDNKGERNVWVADGPAFTARQVTHYHGDEGQPIAGLAISADGWTLVYARGTEANEAGAAANPGHAGKAPRQQVWAIDVEAGAAGKAEPRLLGDMGCGEEGCEDIALSPDGRSAVWAAHGGKLWLADVSGGAAGSGGSGGSRGSGGAGGSGGAARTLHELQGESSQPRWSPDGKRLAFRLDRKGHGYIVVYDLDGDTLRYLAPSSDRDMLPRWSPDGTEIAFIRQPGRQDKLPLIPDRPAPWSIWVADPARGAGRAVWESSRELEGSLPLFIEGSFHFGADHRVVFDSEQEHGGRNHLYSVSTLAPTAGAAEGKRGAASTKGGIGAVSTDGRRDGASPAGLQAAVLLTPGDYDVEEVALAADGRSVLFSANEHAADPADEDRRHLWRVRLAGGTPERLTGGQTIEWSPGEPGDGRSVLCLGSTATRPAMPYRLVGASVRGGAAPAAERRPGTTAGLELLAAHELPADFPSGAMVVPKQVIFKSEDGWTIHGQLFMPRRAPAGEADGAAGTAGPAREAGGGGRKLPALIFTHGGPVRQMLLGFHYMDYYHHTYAMNQYLASRGYAVLSVNYRLGIMYGRRFREVPNGGWRGAAEYQDVLAGARYLRGLPQVDERRIGLWGGSYGGYLTALGLARNSDLFAAGVDFHGVHDWSVFLPSWSGNPALEAPDSKEAVKLAFESSPNSAIKGWRSPVLLIHGDDDRNVPFQQTRDLVQRLRAQQVSFEELVLPDEIHDFLLWRSVVASYQATADFFDRHLQAGAAQQRPGH
jgi:dipeptidyl aminopeptidase/acylaminoacyl peptidase